MMLPSQLWSVLNNGFIFNLANVTSTNTELRIAQQILDSFVDENRATLESDCQYVITHDVISDLPEEERRALGLPDPFPFALKVSSSGNLADRDLKYKFMFLKDGTTPFINPMRVGAFLSITPEQTYILNGDLYRIIKAIDHFNSQSRETSAIAQMQKNLLAFADIKGLSRKTATILDSYLHSEDVIKPSKVSVRIRKGNDGSIEIEPELLCEDDCSDDMLPKIEIEHGVSTGFINAFDKWDTVRSMYPIPGGPRVILGEKQKEALEQVKLNRRLTGDKKEVFLKAPQEILTSEGFQLEGFADRVLEIGEYKPRVFPFLRPHKESWLPPEGGLVIDGELISIPPKELVSLQKSIIGALKEGKPVISWSGKSIPASEETLKSIQELTETGIANERTTSEIIRNIRKTGAKNVLIIQDNLGSLEFKSDVAPRSGEFRIPASLKTGVELLEHQKQGLQWMQEIWQNGHKGALLADDMGLGKTLQALCFLTWVKGMMERGEIPNKPMLVVAPVVLLENWKEEYYRFFDSALLGKPVEMHGSELGRFKNRDNAKMLGIRKETDIAELPSIQAVMCEGRGLLFDPVDLMHESLVLTTYETLRDYQLSFGLVEWGVLVLDEAQKIKTPTAMVTTAIKAMKYEFGLALTGTPVENSWVDLWSIMDFIQPGKLGSLKEFNQQYQAPLRKVDTNREQLGVELKEKSSPLIMRRMKQEQLKGLPMKTVFPYEVAMPQIQLNAYMSVVRSAREQLPDKLDASRKQHILQTISKLRDVSLHPFLLTHSEQGFAEASVTEIVSSSARLSKTFELLEEIKDRNEKALIFLLSHKMQRILQILLEKHFNIQCLRPINGEVAGVRRKEIVDAFQSRQGFQVLILSPEAAGVGLNIVAANNVIHLSRAWNPAKEDQATDRIYRIGQKKPVMVHLPIATHPSLGEMGAFDQKLHRLLEHKRQLSSSVLLPPAVEENEMHIFGVDLITSGCDNSSCDTQYLTLEDVDRLSPLTFEKVVGKAYEKQGYHIEYTPQSNDYGADVIALPAEKGSRGLVIQCKHTISPDRTIGPSGVQEVCTAVGVYRRSYGIEFDSVLVTNARDFSANACQLATSNRVKLCNRATLVDYLRARPITINEIFI